MGRRVATSVLLLALLAGFATAVAVPLGWFGRNSSHAASPTTTVAHRAHHRPPPRRVNGPHYSPVPILMYHVLGTPSPSAAYPQLFVTAADFQAQVAWLARNGYHAVTLRQVFRYWRAAIALPPKPVVLSFDDGYLSDYTVAMPALKRHGWPGVLNLIVHNVRPGDLVAGQVRKLIAAGWEIDSHTVTHADLPTLDPARLRYEVAGSRTLLRRMFHQPVAFFCYPIGHYNAGVVAAVRAAGYLGATTENPGLGKPSQAYTLSRIRVSYGDGAPQLAQKLASALG
jgi:peptidoglycan/xylan/chitin deacetylase (PgdA/CDA1 family)